MHSRIAITALTLIAVSSLPAQARPPKLSGKYAEFGVALCSARIKATGTNVTGQENGVLNVLNGYITFTPKSATTGHAVMALTQIRGPNTTVNASNSGWRQQPLNQSGAYTLSDNKIVFAGATYVATYANIVGGIAKTVNLSRRETAPNPDCVDAVTLTRTR